MILGFNLVGLLVLILPPLLYAWIIYISSPYKSLSLKNSLSFVVGGVFSVVILDTLSFLTPYWNTLYILDPFWQQFWATAPKEEISKFFISSIFT